MSSGTWNRGNGVSAPTPGKPRIYFTKTWNGGDSIVTRTTPHPVVQMVYKRVGSRKVTVKSYQKTKSGKFHWVTREVWVVDRRVVAKERSAGYSKFRITTPEQVRDYYPASIMTMLPNAVKRREDMAGLNDRDPIVEKLPGSPGTPVVRRDKARPPKRARLQDNAYTMSSMYMRDVSVHYKQRIHTSLDPLVCIPYPDTHFNVSTWQYQDWTIAYFLTAADYTKRALKLRELVTGSEFNAAVALGELNESIDLIVNSAVRINRYCAEVRRGRFTRATKALLDPLSGTGKSSSTKTRVKRSAKEIASYHLSMEYGWKPLLNDVVTGAEALAHALNTPVQKTYRTSVAQRRNYQRKTVIPATPPCNTDSITIYGNCSKTHQAGVIARFREKPTIPKLLGLLDPEVVLWEKVPFSFIADWFIPLGDWLTARGFAQGLDATFVYSSKLTAQAFEPYWNSDRIYKPVPADGAMLFSQVEFQRSISSTLLVRPPVEKPLSKAASWRHVTNAVSLVIANHGGRGYK